MIDYDRMSTSYSLEFIEVSDTLLPLRNMRQSYSNQINYTHAHNECTQHQNITQLGSYSRGLL